MNIEALERYCTENINFEDSVLKEIERETYLEVLNPHMLSGSYQGQLLSILATMAQPKNILEIGTFTGYASICLARSLSVNGLLTTIEIDPMLEDRIRNNFERANVMQQINLIIGDAKDVVPTLTTSFDFVFLDAAKGDYLYLFDLLIPKMPKGGILLVDNVLWKGEVLRERRKSIAETIYQFNEKVKYDSRVKQLILPLRDGLMVCVKE